MAHDKQALLRANLKQLRLPTMAAEFEKLAREAAAANENFEQYLLRLTELEVAARGSKALQTRIRQASFPVAKDFDTFDFSCVPHVSKPKVLELARGDWIEQKSNVCLVGSPGTGKTHLATALGLAACRQGKRVRFFTAGKLVTKLEQAQKQFLVAPSDDARLQKAAEWFLDNYYLIRRVARQVDEELPRGFVRHLPELASGPAKGRPRIYALARAVVLGRSLDFDVTELRGFVERYQEVSPLTIAELWALPTMLRVSVLRALLRFLQDLHVVDADDRPSEPLSLDAGAGVERAVRALR